MYSANDNILRSVLGVFAAAALTLTVFYGAAGPDPRADSYAAAPTQAAADQTSGKLAA
jgi:hypothetical protein|tara:strand:- start:92299 stop:92472 length:174 start_codon:yes stop_codon:yes gene_type:complete